MGPGSQAQKVPKMSPKSQDILMIVRTQKHRIIIINAKAYSTPIKTTLIKSNADWPAL